MRALLQALRTGPLVVLGTNVFIGLAMILAGAVAFGVAVIVLAPIHVVALRVLTSWLQARVETIRPRTFDAILGGFLASVGVLCQGPILAATLFNPSPALTVLAMLVGASITLVAMHQTGMRPRVYLGHALPAFALLCGAAASHGFAASLTQGLVTLMALGLTVTTLAFLAMHTLRANARIASLAAKRKALVEELQVKSEVASQNALRLEMALDLGAAAAWDIDLVGRHIVGSSGLAKILGRDFTFERFLDRTGLLMVAPEDRDRVQNVMAALLTAPCKAEIEHRVVRPDGSFIWVHSTGLSMAGPEGKVVRALILTSDITERKAEETALLRALTQAETALAAKRALLSSLHKEAAEPAAPADAADGRTFAAMHERLNQLLSEIETRDHALETAVGALREARFRAEEANHAKSQFLATMSHELRTPLNAIIGYSEIMREAAEEERRATDVGDHDRVLSAAQRLLRMIGDVLDFSKIDAGKMEIDVYGFQVAEMAADIAATVRPQVEARGNRLIVTLPDHLGEAETDAFKLSQCLLNLLSNAAKFTSDGDVTLAVDRETRADGDWLSFSVTDTGIGVAADKLEKLFEPFTQADASTTRAYGGTGLGLAITARIVTLLGGGDRSRKRPGRGLAIHHSGSGPVARAHRRGGVRGIRKQPIPLSKSARLVHREGRGRRA